ncbi:MAG TPA: cytochrome b/b6 domain-containing protein [Candidatus Thiothrix moscowensis]|uniref:cytochrome b/b6 domain-containing protein n=1 Tax=unclassified Thiothrix TaxID=2636184 RepID=UPI0025F2959C|nr:MULTISPECIES: cytochrome b/b6 domain-containing protein [unclassified Thiothrix]HRJ51590.1 cytochrome b/b6 domain-containing protein [Candidatus Thiothrix moscowensis]HRJ91905.1 cytochrome b/b6 domain-containing protein [Candidatus Thiothrix moscowensis]
MENQSKTVRVWDPLVRIFHWSLVASFAVAYLSAEEWESVHEISGYIAFGLILFRILWGFIGSQHARFSDFIYSPQAVIEYLRSLLTTHPKHYLGHNPAGGWMVVLLLLGVLATGFTGIKLLAVEEGRGPLAQMDVPSLVSPAYADRDEDEEHEGKAQGEKEAGEEFWEEAHEVATNLTLLLVFLHVLGVVVSSRLHGENLVRAMVTGNKNLPEKDSV